MLTACDSSLAMIAETAKNAKIAAAEASSLGLTLPECLSYLRDNLYFHLGPREQQGLELFYRHAAQLDLVPPGVDLGSFHCEPA